MEYKYNLGNVNITSNKPLRYPLGHIPNAKDSVSFKVGSVVRRNDFKRVSEFYSVSDDNEGVYFQVSPMTSIVFRMLIEGIRKSDTIVTCNRSYYNIVKGSVGQVYPPEVNVHDIIVAKLIRKGIVPLHAAVFEICGKCLVIIAPPDTGKSLTCALAILQGAKFMGDDGVLTDGDNVYQINQEVKYLNATFINTLGKTTLKAKILQSINNAFPFTKYIIGRFGFPISDLKVPIIEKGTIDAVVILNRGNWFVGELEKIDALLRIIPINRKELHYFKNEILLIYACYDARSAVRTLMASEQSILQKLVDNHKVFLCSSPNPIQFFTMIKEHIISEIK